MNVLRFIALTLACCGWLVVGLNAQTNSPVFLHGDGIENFYQLTPSIYSGSAPEGERGFATLKERGVKTVISVDGTKPEVVLAKKYGLRYVHLPVGYDGIPMEQGINLVKAAQELPQPIYVHCHHGLHRGPAGAAIVCEGTANWTHAQAVSWLKQAGTSTNYPGLYRSVENFEVPTADKLRTAPNDFPEVAKTSSLVDTMVGIDQRFDYLKLSGKSDFQALEANPDTSPLSEAVLLHESFKELLRNRDIQRRGNDFVQQMMMAEKAARDLCFELSSARVVAARADNCLQKLNNACASCHKAHRNGKVD